MTDEQLLSLLRVPDLSEKQSGLSRFATGAISAPARAVGGIADAFNNWFGKGVSPEDNLALGSIPVSRAEVDELTANPTPESTGEWVGEIGNQLSPMALQIMATGRAVAPVANVVRSPVAAAAIRNAAEFGVLGAQHSADLGAEQAIEGGAYGVARALPNRYRWLATAPIAYASKVWFDQHDPNPIAPEVLGGTTQGDLNAILGFATSFGKQLPLRGVRNHFTTPVEPSGYNYAGAADEMKSRQAQSIVDDVLNESAPTSRAFSDSPAEEWSRSWVPKPKAEPVVEPPVATNASWNTYYSQPQTQEVNTLTDEALALKQSLGVKYSGTPSLSEQARPSIPTLVRPQGDASIAMAAEAQRAQPATAAVNPMDWYRTEAEVAASNRDLQAKLASEADRIRWAEQAKANPQPADVPTEWQMMVEQRRRAMYGEPYATDAAAKPQVEVPLPKKVEPPQPSGYRTPDWSIMETPPTTHELEAAARIDRQRVISNVERDALATRARLQAGNPEADPVAVKGKLRPKRSWEKEEGGISDDMSQAMGKAALGATAGAGVGAPSGNAGMGAAIGVVAAFSPQLAKKLASGASSIDDAIRELGEKVGLLNKYNPQHERATKAIEALSNLKTAEAKPATKISLPKGFAVTEGKAYSHRPNGSVIIANRNKANDLVVWSPDFPEYKIIARTTEEIEQAANHLADKAKIVPEPSAYLDSSIRDIMESKGEDAAILESIKRLITKRFKDQMDNYGSINQAAWVPNSSRELVRVFNDQIYLEGASSDLRSVGERASRESKYIEGYKLLRSDSEKFNIAASRLEKKLEGLVAKGLLEKVESPGRGFKGTTIEYRLPENAERKLVEELNAHREYWRSRPQTEPTSTKTLDELATNAKGLQKLNKGEAGFALPAVNQAMARASLGAAGGAVLGSLSDAHGENSGLAMGAITGALVATFGPEAAIGLKNFITKERLPVTKTSTTNVLKSLAQRREEIAGRAFNNTDVMSRFVRWIDRTFEATLPEDIKQSLIRSEGIANFHVSQVDAALEKLAKGYEPNAKLIEAANRYLDGDGLTADQFAQIAKTLDPNSGNYADFVISARENINALQRLVEAGANDKQASILSNSIGKYLTRSYKLFTHKSWLPSEESINKLVEELKGTKSFEGASDEQIRFHLKHYVKEAKLKQTFYTGFSGEGERIAQASFQGRKSLSDAWLDFLGVIKDPKERVLHTALRLKPMAEAGNYFATIAKQEVEGMTQVFDDFAAVEAMRTNLKGKLSTATKEEAEQININLAKLDSLQQLDKQPHYGSLGGKLVTRNVADSLAGIEQMADPKSGFFRSMSKFNTLIKTGDTVLHPITMLRNYLATPVMMGIARVNPANLKEAHQILMNPKHPLAKEIFEMGIANADQVSGELIRDFKQATGGTLDLSSTLSTMLGLNQAQADIVTKSAMKPLQLMQSAYRYPDNMTRVAAYLSARARFADKLGLPETAQEVKDLAAKFTHRYTMNYAAVMPAVKIARQMPFVSQFISYTAEAARITKNLFEDVLKGDNGYNHSRMMALMPIAALAFGPEIISGAGESNLSLSEKAEWEKMKSLMPDWERGTYKYVHGKKDGKFQYSTFSPLIPTDSINQLFASIAKGDFKAALENNPIFSRENTPMLNLASSIVYGEDYKTHKKYRGFGDFAAVAAREILPPLFPTGSEWEKMQQAYTRNTEGREGLKIKGRNITPDMFWKPYWSGMRISESSLSDLQKMAVQRAKSAIAAESSYVNDILKSNAAPEVKAPIVERSKKAIQLIQASLRDQLQDVPR